MADDFADWYVHTVDVDTITGYDEWNKATIETHKNVPCWIDDKIQLVRDQEGEEVVSTATLGIALEYAAWFVPGSVVKVRDRSSRVIQVALGDSTTSDSIDGAMVTLA